MRLYILFIPFLLILQAQVNSQNLLPMQSVDQIIHLSPVSDTNFRIQKIQGSDPFLQISEIMDLPLAIQTPFVSFSISVEKNLLSPNSTFLVQVNDFETQEIVWYDLIMDEHEDKQDAKYLHSLPIYIPEGKETFRIIASADQLNSKIKFHLNLHIFNPGHSENADIIQDEKSTDRNENCEQPAFQNRLDWCSDCPEDATPEFTIPTHLIIHHSAGSNSSSDWAAVVRSIWDYHVNVRGWDDIGYNWLIDPKGIIYEGRGDDRQGAHFCGYNAETMGCCMMGTYTNTKPSDVSLETLLSLMAWKCMDLGINPTESSLHNSSGFVLKHISGHRDGCNTECPGSSFYEDFDNFRAEVQTFIEEECIEIPISTEEITLTPNPTHGFFTLKNPFDEKLDLALFSTDGKLILTSSIGEKSALFFDLPQLPNGIYLLFLDGATVHWKHKFVVL